jgi:recombination DNA repair RAD52 pathway protein
MYDEMNEWYGKSGKFQENVHTLDMLKKPEHVDVGEISRRERNEDNDKSKLKEKIETIDVGEGIERSKLKRKVETTNIGEASSGRKKKIDPEVEETLCLLKQRDQTLSENLEAQARFRDTMLANHNERHQSFMDLERRRLDIEEQRNNIMATQVQSLLAIANNLATSLGVIVDSLKEKP